VKGVGEVQSLFLEIANAQHPLVLRRGGVLREARLAYETYGGLNPAKDNAILLFHALSGSQHAAGINVCVPGVEGYWAEECRVGWWDPFIGPGRALDTDRFFVICANYLGSCYGSTGPACIDPEQGRPYGSSFPWITLPDIVDTQVRLLDFLGIDQLHCVMGVSLGGMAAVSFATRYPARTRMVMPIGSGLMVTMLQRIHNFEQICAIEFDPEFKGGDYYGGLGPRRGLALARMIGHKTFVSLETMEQRARNELRFNGEFGQYHLTHHIESYMLHQGNKFVQRFDANSYLCIMGVWQSIDLLADADVSSFGELFAPCRKQRYMVFSIDSDVCFYPEEQGFMVKELRAARVPVRHVTIHSEKGHDSFLTEAQLFLPHISHALEDDWWVGV